MRLARVRFTIRRILVLVATVAVLLGVGRWAQDRYGGPLMVQVYYVGDLITPGSPIGGVAKVAELSKQAELLKASVTPEVWWVRSRALAVVPFPLSMSLIVRHTAGGHREVGEWVRQQRKLLEARNR
jgi:hypothetical protein